MNDLNKLEKIEQDICDEGVDVIEYKFNSKKIKGIYFEGTIGINKSISSKTEKTCILAEELGHHKKNAGNIINDAKEEKKGRMWGFNKLVGLDGLIDAFENDCKTIEEFSEHLNVTYDYLIECLTAYTAKYGERVKYQDCIVQFIPYLDIKKIK